MTNHTTTDETTTTTFADLKVGDCFLFVRRPHPLGWPDGPWEKTGADAVCHVHNGAEGTVEDEHAAVRIVQVKRWTASRVRRDLPAVKVKSTASATIYIGEVAGRSRDFATVYWDGGRTAEWAWETVANCLNSGKPLLY